MKLTVVVQRFGFCLTTFYCRQGLLASVADALFQTRMRARSLFLNTQFDFSDCRRNPTRVLPGSRFPFLSESLPGKTGLRYAASASPNVDGLAIVPFDRHRQPDACSGYFCSGPRPRAPSPVRAGCKLNRAVDRCSENAPKRSFATSTFNSSGKDVKRSSSRRNRRVPRECVHV